MQKFPGISFFNTTIFSPSGVPIPLNTDEDLMYYSKNTSFYLQLGDGIPVNTRIYRSLDGIIYISNYRIIYKAQSNNNFESFRAFIKDILSVEETVINFLDEGVHCSLFLGFKDAHKAVFSKVLSELIEQNKEIEEEVPYYSELFPKY